MFKRFSNLNAVVILTVMLSVGLGQSAFAGTYAYVDVAKLFDEYQKTKDNDTVLKSMGEEKEKQREAIVKEIRSLKDELVLLTDEAKKEKQDLLDQKIIKLQDFDRDAKRELSENRSKLVKEIFQDIDDVVQVYGEKKGHDMILNERALLYRNEKFDVTADILAELNKGYKK
jgi:outer membrane protein